MLTRKLLATLVAATISSAAGADSSQLATAMAVSRTSLRLEDDRLAGPGARLLLDAAAQAQFVNLGESHNNRDIPPITAALFHLLHEVHGFEYFATEQDPLMMQRISEEPVRGNLDKIRELARLYPHGFTFISDQELEMLAAIGAISAAKGRPIWGAEQAFGATHYIDELIELAPDASSRAAVVGWRDEVGPIEESRDLSGTHFMADVRDKWEKLERLEEILAPRAGSRARFLLDALSISDEIYGYYSRARAGEVVGLFNNTVREAYMKRRFIEEYRIAEAIEQQSPRVLLKHGQWHLYHGRGPGNAYTLGNFTHELAIANGMEAVGIFMVAYEGASDLAKWPGWIKPLLDSSVERGWWLYDLRPLRPLAHARRFHDEVAAESLDLFLRVIFGYEFLLVLAGSEGASYEFTGWEY